MSRAAWLLYPLVFLLSLLSGLCFMSFWAMHGQASDAKLTPFLVAGGGCALLLILLLVMGPSTPPTSTRMRGCALGGGLIGVVLMMIPPINMFLLFTLYLVLGGRFSVVL